MSYLRASAILRVPAILGLYFLLPELVAISSDHFERLDLQATSKPGIFLANFGFGSRVYKSRNDAGLFPAALKRLTVKYNIKTLHISVARGRMELSGRKELHLPPQGVTLRVEMREAGARTEGLFQELCSELGLLLGIPLSRVREEGVVAAPVVGWFHEEAAVSTQIYASFPTDSCCTGHLTSWVNLTPCRGAAGLAALLNHTAFAASPFVALQLSLEEVGGGEGAVQGGGGEGGGRGLCDAPEWGGSGGGVPSGMERSTTKRRCCASSDSMLSMEHSVSVVLPGSVAGPGDPGREVQAGPGAQGGRQDLKEDLDQIHLGSGDLGSVLQPDVGWVAEHLQDLLGSALPDACQVMSSSELHLPGSFFGGPGRRYTGAAGEMSAEERSHGSSASSSMQAGMAGERYERSVQCMLEGSQHQGGSGSAEGKLRCKAARCWDKSISTAAVNTCRKGSPLTEGLHKLRQQEQQVWRADVASHVAWQGPSAGDLILSVRVSNPYIPTTTLEMGTLVDATSRSEKCCHQHYHQQQCCKEEEGATGEEECENAETCGSGGSHAGNPMDMPAPLLHIFQAVPWQLPIMLRTLTLTLDGQEVPLSSPLVARHHLAPSPGHHVPSVLELLLQLPLGTAKEGKGGLKGGRGGVPAPWSLTLSVGFTKLMVPVFLQPPDSSRGVDIPAAEVALVTEGCHSSRQTPLGKGSCRGGSTPADTCSTECAVQKAYGVVHTVLLPIPDLSMPFNVCCFTSTVLAVYFGGVLNALLRLPESSSTADGLALNENAGRGRRRAVLKRMLLLGLLGASLAVYLDKGLQRTANAYLQPYGI